MPWVVGLIVFGGTDVEVDEGPTIESAFQRGLGTMHRCVGEGRCRSTQQKILAGQEGSEIDRRWY